MAKQPRSPSKVHCMLMPRSALQVPGLGLGSAARKVPNVVHAVGTGTNLGPGSGVVGICSCTRISAGLLLSLLGQCRRDARKYEKI